MGKKQHQSDKLYLTTTEWSKYYGGHKGTAKKSKDFKRLPFDCCSLAMTPFEHPYCTVDGVIFDITSIVPFLKKYGVSPVTGRKMTAKDLIKLNFHKNAKEQYDCPVTFKVFNENTHIVAIKTTGNVFAFEAVEKLNIKANFWKDLINDQPFTRKDIITIQNPMDLEKFNISNFYFLKQDVKLAEAVKKSATDNINEKNMNNETKETLAELAKDYKPPDWEITTHPKQAVKKADNVNAAVYSTGRVAASFTSTSMEPVLEHEAAIVDEQTVIYGRVNKKAYVRLVTNYGNINLEIHSDMVVKIADNFVTHCRNGYFKGTKFHRSIRNFMIQGGDPTGTGKGGESIWKKPFEDEFKPNLIHKGRGILSMANSGPNTNKSQFFITYRSCRQLDGKHSVFGKVVGGLDVLTAIENVEVDDKCRPKDEIKILDTQVFVDPYKEVEEQLAAERQKFAEETAAAAAKPRETIRDSVTKPKEFGSGVCKYLNLKRIKRENEMSSDLAEEPVKKKVKGKGGLTDFSAF